MLPCGLQKLSSILLCWTCLLEEEDTPRIRNPSTLIKLALYAVPNPGEAAREYLPPWHAVRIDLEEREFEEDRKKWQKEHAKKFRYLMEECRWVGDLNWTWSLFPSHVVVLSQSNEVTVFFFIERR